MPALLFNPPAENFTQSSINLRFCGKAAGHSQLAFFPFFLAPWLIPGLLNGFHMKGLCGLCFVTFCVFLTH